MARKSTEDIWALIDEAEKKMKAAKPPKVQISGNSSSTPSRQMVMGNTPSGTKIGENPAASNNALLFSFLKTVQSMIGNQVSKQAASMSEADPFISKAVTSHAAEQASLITPQTPSSFFMNEAPLGAGTSSTVTIPTKPASDKSSSSLTANNNAGAFEDLTKALNYRSSLPRFLTNENGQAMLDSSFRPIPNPDYEELSNVIDNFNQLHGKTALIDHQAKIDKEAFRIKAETITANEAVQNALANKNYEEAVRSNKAVEALRQEEFTLSQRQQQLNFLQIIASNPSILYYMKQAGVLDMLTSQLGLKVSDVIGEPLGQVGLPNVQQLAKMKPQQRELLYFQLQAQTGMSRQEIEQMILSQQPGPGQVSRQTL